MEQMTKYEKARIIGARALQISMGAPFMVKLLEKDLEALHYNPIEIAKLEFEKGVVPLSIHKPEAGQRHSEEEPAAKSAQ